jgi:hypothetical protein
MNPSKVFSLRSATYKTVRKLASLTISRMPRESISAGISQLNEALTGD